MSSSQSKAGPKTPATASVSSSFSKLYKYTLIVGVVIGAIAYQMYGKSIVTVTLGVRRKVDSIAEFPNYRCRRIDDDPKLQACEDMWLSEGTRQLFLACSDPRGRQQWMPNLQRLNASGRSLTDAVIAMDIDKPKGHSFDYRVLETPSFTSGDGRLNLVGMDGDDSGTSIKLALVNSRPHFDAAGNLLDNTKSGADPVVEFFETTANAKSLRHVQTYAHPEIRTPNRIALAPSAGGFYISNDHGTAKTGWKAQVAPFISNGDITFCSRITSRPVCRVVSASHKFPNGLLMTRRSKHLAVPSAHEGGIRVFAADNINGSLTELGGIYLPMPIDNLSEDSNGDIWLAAIPKALQIDQMLQDPWKVQSASSIFKLHTGSSKGGEEMTVEKVLEDGMSEVLGGATSVVHDVKTGRLFISGFISPFITVCDRVG